jgi:hypothetical protein
VSSGCGGGRDDLHLVDFLLLAVQRQRDGTWVSDLMCGCVYLILCVVLNSVGKVASESGGAGNWIGNLYRYVVRFMNLFFDCGPTSFAV